MFRMGKSEPKLTVVYFQGIQDKRDVMRFKYYLKDVKNKVGKPMFINEFTPATTQERRKTERLIFESCKMADPPLEVKYTQQGLSIQGNTYIPRVKVPTAKELIDISPDELKTILQMKLESGQAVTQDKSVFEGFTASVQNYVQIRKLYVKVKLMQPTARHIICAYMIPGSEKHYQQNFCDDGEPGAGRTLLSMMQRSNLMNRVIFVARKYGGIRMGTDRFECYEQAGKIAVMEAPQNEVLGHRQTVVPKQKVSAQSVPKFASDETDEKKADENSIHQTSRPTANPRRAPQRRGPSTPRGQFQSFRGRYQAMSNTRRGRYNPRLYPPSYAHYHRPQAYTDDNSWEYTRGEDWADQDDRHYYEHSHKKSDYSVG